MAGEYKFNAGEYEQVFARMFGDNAWKEGMAEASLLGRSNVEVDFAKQLYMARLKAAEEAASRRSRGGSGGSGGSKKSGSGELSSNSKTTTNKLLNEFRAEKSQAQLSPLEVYNNQEKENMGVSVVRNVPVTPIAQNRNLSEYDKMKLIQSDAAYQKRSRR